jgi:hypothetical protein
MFRQLSGRDMRVSRSPFTIDAMTYIVLDIQKNGKINVDISLSKRIKYVFRWAIPVVFDMITISR